MVLWSKWNSNVGARDLVSQYLIKYLLIIFTDSDDCMHGFPTVSELRQLTQQVNINAVVSRPRQQRLFPGIQFTCSSFVTKWIVGSLVTNIGNAIQMPELQIWRKIGSNNYTNVGSTVLNITTPSSQLNVYEYAVDPPLMFQEGDILGVYQPREEESTLVVYYQENSGPLNYIQTVDFPLDNFMYSGTAASGYDYPLVSVEIDTGNLSIIIAITLYLYFNDHC